MSVQFEHPHGDLIHCKHDLIEFILLDKHQFGSTFLFTRKQPAAGENCLAPLFFRAEPFDDTALNANERTLQREST